jgi:hypothetical protein
MYGRSVAARWMANTQVTAHARLSADRRRDLLHCRQAVRKAPRRRCRPEAIIERRGRPGASRGANGSPSMRLLHLETVRPARAGTSRLCAAHGRHGLGGPRRLCRSCAHAGRAGAAHLARAAVRKLLRREADRHADSPHAPCAPDCSRRGCPMRRELPLRRIRGWRRRSLVRRSTVLPS